MEQRSYANPAALTDGSGGHVTAVLEESLRIPKDYPVQLYTVAISGRSLFTITIISPGCILGDS